MALFDYPPITWNPLGAPSQVNIPMFTPSEPTLFPPAQPVSAPSMPSMMPAQPLPTQGMESGYGPSYDPNEAGITTDPAQFALSALGAMNPALTALGTIGTMGAFNVNPETPGFLGGLSTAFGDDPDLGYGDAMGLGDYGPASVESVEESMGYGDAMGLGGYGPDEATEASAAYGDAFGLEGYADDSDSDAGDDTVICTAFYDAGIVSRETHRRTSLEGARMGADVIRGYHLWGKPVARLIRRHKWLQRPAYAILRPYLEQIAGGDHGWIVRAGIAVCRALGRWTAPAADGAPGRLAGFEAVGGTGDQGFVASSGYFQPDGGFSGEPKAVVGDLARIGHSDAGGDRGGRDHGHSRPRPGAGVPDYRLHRAGCEGMGGYGPGYPGSVGENEWMSAYDPACPTGLEAFADAKGV